MKVFYCHHALRDLGNPPTQEDGLKELGIKDANLVGQIFQDNKKSKVKAIYTSTYFRCRETANIINKYLNVPVIDDARLNEYVGVHNAVKGIDNDKDIETWKDAQERVIDAIKDVVIAGDDNDMVIMVTSGVNITAFVALAYGIKPSNDLPFPLVPSCSVVGFDITKEMIKNI
jgi:broad specificity phosphatase PhoE